MPQSKKGNGKELAQPVRRFKEALGKWTSGVAELGNWIRYSPPPPETKRFEPWIDDNEDEEEEQSGGPETIH